MDSLKKFMEAMNVRMNGFERMPVMFVGHGNPMNAIEQNEYTASWEEIGKNLPKPKAILTISAHWLTRGPAVTAMERPRTIHDFGGFPKALYDQQYPAPGSPEYAAITKNMVKKTEIHSDYDWGLDHGTWSFLLPMIPAADIPVYQLSIDYYKPLSYHYELASELSALRDKGVLIIGSGNIVHNLSKVDFSINKGYEWADEFDHTIKNFISTGDHQGVIQYEKLGALANLAVPTHDHYLPLIYSLALVNKEEPMLFFNDRTDVGSISMTSFISG
jgi:4,5-DOPA dioxygenase extradiol